MIFSMLDFIAALAAVTAEVAGERGWLPSRLPIELLEPASGDRLVLFT